MCFTEERMWAGHVREATRDDLPFLREMLFEAVFWRPDQKRPPIDEGLAGPELSRILENPSRLLYDRFGFEFVHEYGGAWTMVKVLLR
jgi:hypothetical protein